VNKDNLLKRVEKLEAKAVPAEPAIDPELELMFSEMSDAELEAFIAERAELAAQDPALRERWAKLDQMTLPELEAHLRAYCQPPAARGNAT
jgi:hypothetical protein